MQGHRSVLHTFVRDPNINEYRSHCRLDSYPTTRPKNAKITISNDPNSAQRPRAQADNPRTKPRKSREQNVDISTFASTPPRLTDNTTITIYDTETYKRETAYWRSADAVRHATSWTPFCAEPQPWSRFGHGVRWLLVRRAARNPLTITLAITLRITFTFTIDITVTAREPTAADQWRKQHRQQWQKPQPQWRTEC